MCILNSGGLIKLCQIIKLHLTVSVNCPNSKFGTWSQLAMESTPSDMKVSIFIILDAIYPLNLFVLNEKKYV